MQYINIQTFNANHLGRIDRSRVYFNPDTSVAIFEEGDQDILDYVTEKAAKLRSAGFAMNPTNESLIRDYLKNLPASARKKPAAEFASAPLEPTPLFSEEKYAEILEELEDKPTTAKLAVIVKVILMALQQK